MEYCVPYAMQFSQGCYWSLLQFSFKLLGLIFKSVLLLYYLEY